MCNAQCLLDAKARNGASLAGIRVQDVGKVPALLTSMRQRSTVTPVWSWHPLLSAWIDACEKSPATAEHEPFGQSFDSANREKP